MNELVQYLPKKAYQCLQANVAALLFDVCTKAENKFVGRPLNSMLVPWVDEPDWQPHLQNFIAAIKRFIGGEILNTKIILIFRSGYRSNVAYIISRFAGDLDEDHQRGKLNGWRYDGLLWEQC